MASGTRCPASPRLHLRTTRTTYWIIINFYRNLKPRISITQNQIIWKISFPKLFYSVLVSVPVSISVPVSVLVSVHVPVSVSVPQSPSGPPGEGLDEELCSGERYGPTSAALSGVQPVPEEGSTAGHVSMLLLALAGGILCVCSWTRTFFLFLPHQDFITVSSASVLSVNWLIDMCIFRLLFVKFVCLMMYTNVCQRAKSILSEVLTRLLCFLSCPPLKRCCVQRG